MNDPIVNDMHNTGSQNMVGTLIANRYEIVSKLGSGGFAVVYRAFDKQIERDVAIKILNLDVLSGNEQSRQAMLERFRREARLAARIRHPNVVEIYDLGELENHTHPYIIMEILEGYDLDEELAKYNGMSPSRAIPLFCGALKALAEAHRKDIIHKDIKPANLFLNRPNTNEESLKVVDFGIAHIAGKLDTRLTQTGMMFGTPQYLPPEYIQNQIVTPAMDVYQMGLVLVEMLTGQAVVDAETPWQCAMKHVMRSYSLPEPLLASPLGPVLIRALDANHEIRYPNAGAFVEALLLVDPATIPDVRGTDITQRAFDVDSGEWLPTPGTNTPSVNLQSFGYSGTITQNDMPAAKKSRSILLVGIFVGLLVLIGTALLVLLSLLPSDDADASFVETPTTIETEQPVPAADNNKALAGQIEKARRTAPEVVLEPAIIPEKKVIVPEPSFIAEEKSEPKERKKPKKADDSKKSEQAKKSQKPEKPKKAEQPKPPAQSEPAKVPSMTFAP